MALADPPSRILAFFFAVYSLAHSMPLFLIKDFCFVLSLIHKVVQQKSNVVLMVVISVNFAHN